MTEEELKEIAFELLAIAKSLDLHQSHADAVYSLHRFDAELFHFHSKHYISLIYDTLRNESNFLMEIAEKILKNYE